MPQDREDDEDPYRSNERLADLYTPMATPAPRGRALAVIEPQDDEPLPDPPTPAGIDLRSFPDMPLDVAALRNSGMQTAVTPAEGWYAVNLWAASWHQIPAGSLPADDVALAHLAGLGRDQRTWKRMRAGALRGWRKCSDNRLYHDFIALRVSKAWEQKRSRQRGAEATNALKNQEADKRSAQRSAPRPAPRPASAYAVGTEQNRTKKDTPISPNDGSPSPLQPEAFARFRIAYPKRDGGHPLRPAVKAWNARIRQGVSPETIIAAAPTACKPEKVGTEFCPHQATWLNDPSRWQNTTQNPNSSGLDDDAKILGIDAITLRATVILAYAAANPDGTFTPRPFDAKRWPARFALSAPHIPHSPIPQALVTQWFNEVGLQWNGTGATRREA